MTDPTPETESTIPPPPGEPAAPEPAYRSPWTPELDFVFFRKPAYTQLSAAGLDLSAAAHNMRLCRCVGKGPGRYIAGGFRNFSGEVGDYFYLNAVFEQSSAPNNKGEIMARIPPITDFIDDDGNTTYVVGTEYIIGVRKTLPPEQVGKQAPVIVQPNAFQEVEVTRTKGNGVVKLARH